jgi:hypothetical protein
MSYSGRACGDLNEIHKKQWCHAGDRSPEFPGPYGFLGDCGDMAAAAVRLRLLYFPLLLHSWGRS